MCQKLFRLLKINILKREVGGQGPCFQEGAGGEDKHTGQVVIMLLKKNAG